MRKGAKTPSELRELLSKFELLDGVKDETLTSLLSLGSVREHPEDTFIIAYEDDSQSLLLILEGRVSIERVIEDKVLSIIQRGPGEVVGEIACITGEPRSADIRTITTSTILKVSAKDVHNIFVSDPTFSINMMKLLAGKLRQTVDISTHSSLKLAQKLALEIYSEFKRDRERVGTDRWVLKRKVTQGEWATRVGARRESVNRVFRQFIDEGILDHHEGHLCLLDKKALLSFAEM